MDVSDSVMNSTYFNSWNEMSKPDKPFDFEEAIRNLNLNKEDVEQAKPQEEVIEPKPAPMPPGIIKEYKYYRINKNGEVKEYTQTRYVKGVYKSTTNEQKLAMHNLYYRGYQKKFISEKYGISLPTLNKYLDDAQKIIQQSHQEV